MGRRRVDRCGLWPLCACNLDLALYQRRLDNELLSLDELDGIEVMSFFYLSCMEHRSPDRKARAWAAIQLLHPRWNQAGLRAD
jgi:hypothetical protein